MSIKENSQRRGGMSVGDFAIWAGIGRTTAWNEIRFGRLRAIKASARTLDFSYASGAVERPSTINSQLEKP